MTGDPTHRGPGGGTGDAIQPPAQSHADPLGQQLGGNLPCIVCGYNLRGLSIRSVCPECGTAVRATILAVVDPHATELEPISHPRLTSVGLVLWVLMALGAVCLCWLPAPTGWQYGAWHALVTSMVIASGIGGIGFVRPHAGVRTAGTVAAMVGVLLYVPLAWLVWEVSSLRYTAGYGVIHSPLWFGDQIAHVPAVERTLVCVLACAVCLLLRPNARLLVARSLALRTGRVDRQTILAVVAATIIAAVGEIVLGASRSVHAPLADEFRLAGQILIPAGWALITLGLIGALVDAVRISRAIILPHPSLREVISGPPRAPRDVRETLS